MPIHLIKNKMNIKDGDEYVGIDAITDASTEERIAAINSAGTAQVTAVQNKGTEQVTAVQNKGTEVLNSIPEDYSDLSDDVSSLRDDLNSIPNLENSDAENVDLDISDPNGNVIVRLADGHIYTKNFSSDNISDGNIDVLSQITDPDADLYIADINGNGLARFSNGNIRTKKFNSDQSTYKQIFAYNNTSGTETMNLFFPKGTTLAFHCVQSDVLGSTSIANYKNTYGYIDLSDVPHDLGQEYGYNYLVKILPEDAKSVYVKYGSGLIWGSSGNLVFSVISEANFKRQPVVVEVDANGGRDYTNIRSAVDAIAPYANDFTPYEIHIYPGTYDILADYTSEEINASGFIGLIITNGISLIGIGRRSEIVLTANMDTSEYDQTKRNDVSTLNLQGNNIRLENITINAKNIRYAVHDDLGDMPQKERTHYFTNVKFYGETMTTGDISFGAGGGNFKAIYAKDCDFSGEAHIHNSTDNVRPYYVYMENCSARMFSFADKNAVVASRFFLKNCKAVFIRIVISGDHSTQYLFLDGEGTCGAILTCPTGYVYNLGDCVKILGTEISSGKAVKLLRTASTSNIAVATSLDSVYGVSVGTMDGGTIIQTKGYINSNILGLSNLSVGDYLTIDTTTGSVIVGTASNAIARVTFVDDYGVAHAKLMI